MAQFHETQMGQKFFMRDMPELIKGINRLADAMEKQADAKETCKTNSLSQKQYHPIIEEVDTLKEDIETLLRHMCFGTSREWSENMVNQILNTNVIHNKCIENDITVTEDIIITALMEIVFNINS